MTYKIQIDDQVRNATAEEIAEIKARELQAITEAEAEVAKVSARAELLNRLGITADEAALLLG